MSFKASVGKLRSIGHHIGLDSWSRDLQDEVKTHIARAIPELGSRNPDVEAGYEDARRDWISSTVGLPKF